MIFVAIMWLSTQPMYDLDAEEAAVPEHLAPVGLASAGFGGRSATSSWAGARCAMPPNPITARSDGRRRACASTPRFEIARHAREIYLQSGLSHAMPPGNLTWMEEAERQRIVQWFRSL